MRYPGIPILIGKRDLANAFKLVHLLLADVLSFAWQLPTANLPGLELETLIQVAGSLVFGFDKAPAWFGILAWALAKAHAGLGPEEPDLNGPDSFGGGAPWVDDCMYLSPALGQRVLMSFDA